MSQVPLGRRTPRRSPSISQVLSLLLGRIILQSVWIFQRSFLQEPPPHVVSHASLKSALKRLSRIKCVPGLAHRDKKKAPCFLRVMPLDPSPHEERKKWF